MAVHVWLAAEVLPMRLISWQTEALSTLRRRNVKMQQALVNLCLKSFVVKMISVYTNMWSQHFQISPIEESFWKVTFSHGDGLVWTGASNVPPVYCGRAQKLFSCWSVQDKIPSWGLKNDIQSVTHDRKHNDPHKKLIHHSRGESPFLTKDIRFVLLMVFLT